MNSAAKKATVIALAGLALRDDLKRGPGPTQSQITAAVEAFFRVNPIKVPSDGRDVTDADVQRAVKAYLKAHPIKHGTPGKDAPAVTREQIEAAVFAHLIRHPPKPGKDAREITQYDILKAIEEYFRKHPIKEPASFDDVKLEPGAEMHSYKVLFHHTEKGWVEAGTFKVPRNKMGVIHRAVTGTEAVMAATYDDYEQADTQPKQSGADDVKTFTFDAQVQLVKIHPLANDGTLPAAENRRCWAAGDGDLTPAVGVGDPCPVGSSEHLFGNRSTLKVFVPAGVDCFVTGYRRKTA